MDIEDLFKSELEGQKVTPSKGLFTAVKKGYLLGKWAKIVLIGAISMASVSGVAYVVLQEDKAVVQNEQQLQEGSVPNGPIDKEKVKHELSRTKENEKTLVLNVKDIEQVKNKDSKNEVHAESSSSEKNITAQDAVQSTGGHQSSSNIGIAPTEGTVDSPLESAAAKSKKLGAAFSSPKSESKVAQKNQASSELESAQAKGEQQLAQEKSNDKSNLTNSNAIETPTTAADQDVMIANADEKQAARKQVNGTEITDDQPSPGSTPEVAEQDTSSSTSEEFVNTEATVIDEQQQEKLEQNIKEEDSLNIDELEQELLVIENDSSAITEEVVDQDSSKSKKKIKFPFKLEVAASLDFPIYGDPDYTHSGVGSMAFEANLSYPMFNDRIRIGAGIGAAFGKHEFIGSNSLAWDGIGLPELEVINVSYWTLQAPINLSYKLPLKSDFQLWIGAGLRYSEIISDEEYVFDSEGEEVVINDDFAGSFLVDHWEHLMWYKEVFLKVAKPIKQQLWKLRFNYQFALPHLEFPVSSLNSLEMSRFQIGIATEF